MPAVKTNAQNFPLVIFLQFNFEHLIDEHIEKCKDKNGDALGDTGIILGDPVGDLGLLSILCIKTLKPNGENLGMHTQVTM